MIIGCIDNNHIKKGINGYGFQGTDDYAIKASVPSTHTQLDITCHDIHSVHFEYPVIRSMMARELDETTPARYNIHKSMTQVKQSSYLDIYPNK